MNLRSTEIPARSNFIDHSGEVINGVKLLRYKGITFGNHHVYECKCPYCNNTFDATLPVLRDTKHKSSCGCIHGKSMTLKTDFKYKNMIGKKSLD